MRHRLKGRKLGRTTAHRLATEKNTVANLFTYGRVMTTVEKAKEFRALAERLITRAKKGGLHNFRYCLSQLQNKAVVHKLFRDIAPRFADRPGGYTRVIRLGGSRFDGEGRGRFAMNRLGDNARRALFELVVRKEPKEEKTLLRGESQDAELEKLKVPKKGKAKKK